MTGQSDTRFSLRRALAATIAKARRARGLTQEELAHLAGVHRTYVSLLERGLRSPSVDTLSKIAPALDTTASSLLARAERGARRGG